MLSWLSKGKTNRDIAQILGLSPRTVDKHLEQIYSKLGVENRHRSGGDRGECEEQEVVRGMAACDFSSWPGSSRHHVLSQQEKMWMPGSSPGMTNFARAVASVIQHATVGHQHRAGRRFRDVEPVAVLAADRYVGAAIAGAGLDAGDPFAVRREYEDMTERRMRDEQPARLIHGQPSAAGAEGRAEAADFDTLPSFMNGARQTALSRVIATNRTDLPGSSTRPLLTPVSISNRAGRRFSDGRRAPGGVMQTGLALVGKIDVAIGGDVQVVAAAKRSGIARSQDRHHPPGPRVELHDAVPVVGDEDTPVAADLSACWPAVIFRHQRPFRPGEIRKMCARTGYRRRRRLPSASNDGPSMKQSVGAPGRLASAHSVRSLQAEFIGHRREDFSRDQFWRLPDTSFSWFHP